MSFNIPKIKKKQKQESAAPSPRQTPPEEVHQPRRRPPRVFMAVLVSDGDVIQRVVVQATDTLEALAKCASSFYQNGSLPDAESSAIKVDEVNVLK